MNRRSAIRNVVIISAGAGLLPSCMNNDKGVIPLKNISVTGSQEQMLAGLTEAIIPKTKNFIGAKDLGAHEFVLTMIDDCTSPEEQEKFTDGLKAFDKLSHDKFGQLFTSCTARQKRSLLADIENKKDIPEDVVKFYGTVKRYTVQSFASSKEYLTGIRKYKMVPGPDFKGCVAVTKA
ncbi:MAG: gluconate 2-dehydrogenase subunit 3 family protein [Chitinophagaceae bacterium]